MLFLYTSLPSLHDHNVKFLYATFYGGRKHTTANSSLFFFKKGWFEDNSTNLSK